MIETRDGDVATREAFKLAELFNKMVEDHKVKVPLVDQFVKTWRKLQTQMKHFEESFADCLAIAQKIADCASATQGSSSDIGTCLSRIVMRHKDVGMKIGEWNRELDNGLNQVQSKNASFKKKVGELEKDHTKQLKKMRSVMKKRSKSVIKLENKIKEKKKMHEAGSDNPKKFRISQKKDSELGELLLKCKEFEEQEREAVKNVAGEERNLFGAFLIGLQPLLMVEMAIFQETNKIDEALREVENIIGKENTAFETSDGKVSIVASKNESFPNNMESLGSQKIGSIQSLSSFCGSKLSCNIMADPSCSFKDSVAEPKLFHRASSLSNSSHDSGIDPCHQTVEAENMEASKIAFVPIPTSNIRYSTIRRSPSPFRSPQLSLPNSPSIRGRITSKPPLPKRFPLPARSPFIETPAMFNSKTQNSEPEDILHSLTDAKGDISESVNMIVHASGGEDMLDSPTEEDREVLYYMSGEKEFGLDEWEVTSSCSYDSRQEELFDQSDLPPPPDFLLQEY